MNIIRELRRKKGIQQKDLAIEIGVSTPTISNWETGKNDPAGEHLKKLAEYFGVDELVVLGKGTFIPDNSGMFVPINPEITGKSETEQIVDYILSKLNITSDQKDYQPKTTEARLLAKGVDRMQPERRKAFTDMMINMCPDIFEKGIDNDET